MVNTDSRVFTTSPIDVCEDLIRRATEILRPPMAAVISVGAEFPSKER
jgi:hypothetical protein